MTQLPDIQTHDVVSFLRIAYLATKKGNAFAADLANFATGSLQAFQEHAEWVAAILRSPLSCAHWGELGVNVEAPCQIPEIAISGPTALLSLLTVLARRGLLDKIPSWTTVPAESVPGTNLIQVQQITSAAVTKKLLPLILKRVIAQRENTRRYIPSKPYVARSDYCHVAALAAALVAFDGATNGNQRAGILGTWKELALSLGNAAEMSNRLRDYATALGFAHASLKIIRHVPSGAEAVPHGTEQKNIRRIQTAKEAVRIYTPK